MKPWIGAVVAAAAILAAPSVALAGEDDPAQLQFKLPSTAGGPRLRGPRPRAWTTASQQRRGGSVIVSAWATDEQARLARVHGYEIVGTLADKYAIDRIRAERDKTLAELKAAQGRAAENAAGARARAPRRAHPGPARGLLREQRRPLPLDRGQRRRRRHVGGTNGTATTARPSWPSGSTPPATASAARRTVGVYSDPDVSPDYYQYHYTVFRLGNKGDGGAAARAIKVASSERRRRHARRQGVDRREPAQADRPASGLRHALQRLARGVREDARPRHRVPEHLRGRSSCRSRRAATSAGRRRCSATQHDGTGPTATVVRPLRRQQPARSPARRRPRPAGRARSS